LLLYLKDLTIFLIGPSSLDALRMKKLSWIYKPNALYFESRYILAMSY